MISLELIRKSPDVVKKALAKRSLNVDFTELNKWDKQRKEIIQTNENLKAKRNSASSEIAKLKREGKDATQNIIDTKKFGEEIVKLDADLKEVENNIKTYLASLPNMPDEDIIAGGKENNKVIDVFGKKPEFDFKPKDHVELCESLGLVDYKRGAKLSGKGFYIYTGMGARLEWALLNYFASKHIADGYEFMLVPHILSNECGFTAGQFPKFKDEVFYLDENIKKGHFLLPTSETALVNLHRDEILKEDELPKKYFSYTPCFRTEAGSYRTEERGMIRAHQFNKVEMFQYTKPEDSDAAFDELVKKAQTLMQELGLHHQLSKLAAEDISATMARTYDIEVWIPSMGIYKEVSSVSNAKDYQARRGNIKFRSTEASKNQFVHTLNGSGLATSRLIPAIVEQYQNADGSVTIPKVLRPFMGGLEKIELKK